MSNFISVRLPFILYLVITAFIMGGCSTNSVISDVPSVDAENNSGIGIEVKTVGQLTWINNPLPVSIVYFSKVCNSGEKCDHDLYTSNYAKDGRLYFLNVPTGDYEAVAASTIFGNGDSKNVYVVYFPEKIIKQSRVSVVKGGLAYAGSYLLTLANNICLGEADEAQIYYAEIIEPGTNKCGVLKMIAGKTYEKAKKGEMQYLPGVGFILTGSNITHFRGIIKDATRDRASEDKFISKARDDLSRGGWLLQP